MMAIIDPKTTNGNNIPQNLENNQKHTKPTKNKNDFVMTRKFFSIANKLNKIATRL